MKISKLIKCLEKIKKDHGDLKVYYDYDWSYDHLCVKEIMIFSNFKDIDYKHVCFVDDSDCYEEFKKYYSDVKIEEV